MIERAAETDNFRGGPVGIIRTGRGYRGAATCARARRHGLSAATVVRGAPIGRAAANRRRASGRHCGGTVSFGGVVRSVCCGEACGVASGVLC